MIARVPASSANLGPGFDTLAIALSLYVDVEAVPAERLEVHCIGEGSRVPVNERHLAARVANEVLGHTNVRFNIRSQIPLSRGLGSSAALAAACAASLGASDPFAVASFFDGHPENAAASIFGGFVTAVALESGFISNQLRLDPELVAVVVVPEIELATKKARGALPDRIPFTDATFNLGRMGLLIAGMANIGKLSFDAGQDRLHQQYRSSLFPESRELLEAIRQAGALVACWSGAGPTMIGLCESSNADNIADKLKKLVSGHRFSCTVRVLEIDRQGLVTRNEYGKDFEPLKVASL